MLFIYDIPGNHNDCSLVRGAGSRVLLSRTALEERGQTMRIGYSDDEEYGGQFELWQANCRRSLKGKVGQAALRRLEAALLALPDKRLIAGDLVDDEGGVCAIGALALHEDKITDDMRALSECDMEDVGVELGMPRLVAWKVVEMNDLQFNGLDLVFLEGPERWPAERPYAHVPVTPEVRYERMLAWVREQIDRAA